MITNNHDEAAVFLYAKSTISCGNAAGGCSAFQWFQNIIVSALIDSGAALNILPFDMGIELGLNWEKQTFPIELGGVLKNSQAYAVLLDARIAELQPAQLAFAWINKSSAEIRLLLGQVNFFQEFNVYFYGNEQFFEVESKQS